MGLNQNGQSINLSHGLQACGVTCPEALERHVHQTRSKLTFAQTFPTGTHAMWLYYWLASCDSAYKRRWSTGKLDHGV